MSATKIGENTTNILKLLFFTINLHFVTSNQISTYRKLNLPLTSSIYFVFLSLEMQKTLEQTKLYTRFWLCLKRNDSQTFKVAAPKTLFSSVCVMSTTCFFILCDNWKTLVFLKIQHYSEIFLGAMLLLSLKPVFWKKSVFYALSPQ